MRSAAFFFLIALVLGLGSLSAPARAQQPPSAAGPLLRLHRGTFDAREAGKLTGQTPAGWEAAGAAPTPVAIIQFAGPVSAKQRANLEATGARVLEYLPDYAYLVSGGDGQLAAAAALAGVYARADFTLADKLSPGLLAALGRGEANLGKVNLKGWSDDLAPLKQSLAQAGLRRDQALTADQLLTLARLPEVRWIEARGVSKLQNQRGRQVMNVPAVWQRYGYFGNGQIIAVTDSGIDTGVAATMSPDFAGRIVSTLVLSPGGDMGDQIGHGTHVAGSAAGAGVQSGANPAQHQYESSWAGVAPEAGLVVQAFEATATGEIVGFPIENYYGAFLQAYNAGARIHSNSWGDYTGPETDPEAQFGGYVLSSQITDQFVWDHPEATMLFAAGNSARDGTPGVFGFCTDGNGVVDPDSMVTPATAKNVISVGATESDTQGGYATVPWLLIDFCFSTEPISSDVLANNVNGMAAFSSRGPTDDGRIKPELTALGTNIISNQSHYPEAGQNWGPVESNPNYNYSGGTSMATPQVAGAAALVRQWLAARGMAAPSAAAVKSILLNTTSDQGPGQYGVAAFREIPAERPNMVNGWGRADLGFITAPHPYALWVDDHASGLATGQSVAYNHTTARPLQVLTSTQPLRVMLTWTDPPASLSASRALVNDLDLIVTGPGGQRYYGNNVASGDRINNTEGLIINNPPVGAYSVEVRANNVPVSTQRYALTVAGALSTQSQLQLRKTATPAAEVAPGGLLTYNLALTANYNATNAQVVMTDELPENTEFVSASDGAVRTGPGGSIVQWTIPSIAAGATVNRTLTVRVDPAATDGMTIVNSAYRAANNVDITAVGSPVSVPVRLPRGQLSISKTANPGVFVRAGDLITYTLAIGNQGSPVSTARMTDTLPANTSFVAASGSYVRSGAGGSVIAWPIGALNTGQQASRTLTVRVFPETAPNTVISNNAYQVGAGNANRASGSSVDVTVSGTQLSITKRANANTVRAGDLITYTLRVRAGNVDATNVQVHDVIPNNTVFVSASNKPVVKSGTAYWSFAQLTTSQQLNLTLTVRVQPGTANGTVITNANYGVLAEGTQPVYGEPLSVTVVP
ncbi:MAG TPA: S8 family serine peptidase [Herpetosiphonaceae bacterium]